MTHISYRYLAFCNLYRTIYKRIHHLFIVSLWIIADTIRSKCTTHPSQYTKHNVIEELGWKLGDRGKKCSLGAPSFIIYCSLPGHIDALRVFDSKDTCHTPQLPWSEIYEWSTCNMPRNLRNVCSLLHQNRPYSPCKHDSMQALYCTRIPQIGTGDVQQILCYDMWQYDSD